MSLITQEAVKGLIKKWSETYAHNPEVMLSGYRQEAQTVADYNGRQLLELIQNADDAKSEVVYIVLNTELQLLSVSNNGAAFSLEGIESLMYTGLSTKSKEEYIGNKGLGFRSILNWVHEVTICTQEVGISFSKSYSEEYFKEHLLGLPNVQERIRKEVLEKKLVLDECPVAALAFPQVIECTLADFTTSIILKYKTSELSAIKQQLQTLSEEILLFLPNTKKIIVEQDGLSVHTFEKTEDSENTITINGNCWNIFRIENAEYQSIKFKYAIAWKEGTLKQGMFYSYFPTDVPTDLPCIIHATFDLTSNRKEINDNEANKYILEEVAKSLGTIAHTFLKKESADWDAFRFLSPADNNGRKVLQDFYSAVVQQQEEIGVYPTLCGNYITKHQALYQGRMFSKWAETNGLGQHFPKLLVSADQEEDLDWEDFGKYSISQLIEICRSLSSKIGDHQERAKLIKLFLHESFDQLHKSSLKLPLLIGTEFKYQEEEYNDFVFALKITDKNFSFPDYSNILFIEPLFYAALLNVFETEIEQERGEGAENRSRTIKRLIRTVVNLGSNDITDIVKCIVDDTNKELEESHDLKQTIGSMVRSLYSLFDPQVSSGNKTTVQGIKLLSRSGNVRDANSLFFGSGYPTGQDTEYIFQGIYTNEDYLEDAIGFGLETGENTTLCSFFEWLGVNKLISFSKSEELNEEDRQTYFEFLCKQKRFQKPDNARAGNISLKGIKINNLCSIKKLSIYKFILLLEKSVQLKMEVNSQVENNSSILSYKYSNSYPKQIASPYSFIYFQLSKLLSFSDFTLSDDTELQIFFKKLDLSNEEITNNLSEAHITSLVVTLRYLGTSETIGDISEEQLINTLEEQEEKFPNGERSQGFYKKCLEYYLSFGNASDNKLRNTATTYFARKGIQGSELKLIPKAQVFYSDNTLLPKSLLEDFYFINIPKRIGEKNVETIFGVRLIKNELHDLRITSFELSPGCEKFKDDFNQLKPYFLCNRLEFIKQSRKQEALLIKSVDIKLVSSLSYQFKGGATRLLNVNEFLPVEGVYYLNAPSFGNLNELRNDPLFCDTIAEIVSMAFNVSTQKNIFRRIFKDGAKDSYHILQADDKLELLDEAKQLLGISLEEQRFWKKVFPHGQWDAEEEMQFTQKVEMEFTGKKLPVDYSKVNFSDLGTKEGVLFLKWLKEQKPNLNLIDIINSNTLQNWHSEQLKNKVKDYAKLFEIEMWEIATAENTLLKKEQFFGALIEFDDAVTKDKFKNFLEAHQFELYPHYEKAISEYVKGTYGFDLQNNSLEVMGIQTKGIITRYKNIIERYSFGDSILDIEKMIKEKSTATYSLLYFEGFEDRVTQICEQLKAERLAENADDNEQLSEDSIFDIVEVDLNKVVSVTNISGVANGSSYTSKTNRRKAAVGRMQEHFVKKALKAKGYEVNDVSYKTDSRHYDLEYKKSGETEWRFLEVKKDSGGYFFLSGSEKTTALNAEYSDRYDVAIVGDGTINLVRNPFQFTNETFEHNSRFYAEPTEYKISFKANRINVIP